jgi:hypothetical protein
MSIKEIQISRVAYAARLYTADLLKSRKTKEECFAARFVMDFRAEKKLRASFVAHQSLLTYTKRPAVELAPIKIEPAFDTKLGARMIKLKIKGR